MFYLESAQRIDARRCLDRRVKGLARLVCAGWKGRLVSSSPDLHRSNSAATDRRGLLFGH